MRSFLTVLCTSRRLGSAAVIWVLMACSTSLTDVPDPSTILDPAAVQSQAGAIGLYKTAVTKFTSVYAGGTLQQFAGSSFALAGGLASDEYMGLDAAATTSGFNLRLVNVLSPYGAIEQPYTDMHDARLAIDLAVGTLRQYAATAPPSYTGELLAYKGFLYVMFAEMYCSGVPFSRIIYDGDIAFGAPETTEAMLQHAVAQFDSALALATDSARIQNLARVGKGRALLDLKRFAEAAAAVADVPTGYTYDLAYTAQGFPSYLAGQVANYTQVSDVWMANRAGSNGLDYVSAGDETGGRVPDPRVRWCMSAGFDPQPEPMKYCSMTAPVTLAGGVEARLIEAEAALHVPDVPGWAAALNALRQTASTPAIPPLTADSTTTASDALRENVLFRERAFWLFGTGHRLGDMRRIVRQYNRPAQTVFPVGVQPRLFSPKNVYSNDTNFEPPLSEIQHNGLYRGCLNRDA